MKGYIPVDIPTKPYIKAYIHHKLGKMPLMRSDNLIGSKLHDLLEHELNPDRKRFLSKLYTTTVRVYLPMRLFKMRGCNLNESNIKRFNSYLETKIKTRFYEVMDDCIEILPNIEANLPQARRKLGIDIEAWSDDSMRKDYQRYRKRTKKPLLYNKKNYASVPSDKFANLAF